jgi:hypothetical protein
VSVGSGRPVPSAPVIIDGKKIQNKTLSGNDLASSPRPASSVVPGLWLSQTRMQARERRLPGCFG